MQARCAAVGVEHVRRPTRDFDAASLRLSIPTAVAALETSVYAGRRVYVHCTAGLGRAPAVAIAFLYWFDPRGLTLDAAYAAVTSKRPCGPKREAIRGATYDLVVGTAPFGNHPDCFAKAREGGGGRFGARGGGRSITRAIGAAAPVSPQRMVLPPCPSP